VRNATDGRAVSTTKLPAILPAPRDVVVVPDTGQLLVTDCVRHQVVLLRGLTDLTEVGVFGHGFGHGDRYLWCPHGMALVSASGVELAADRATATAAAAGQDLTLVAIADSGNCRVVLYRLADAVFVRCIGSRGDAPGKFDHPSCVASVLFLAMFQTLISLRRDREV
jgi:hypothetical protein